MNSIKNLKDVNVFSMTGEIIFSSTAKDKAFSIDTDQWSEGVYFIKVILSDGNIYVLKSFIHH